MLQPLLRRYAGALIYDGSRVLLGKRAAHRARYPGVWDIFGGHVETGEDPLAALRRELKEELNICVSRARQVGILTGYDQDDAVAFEMTVFLVCDWDAPMRLHPAEHDEMRWFKPAELGAVWPVIDPRLPEAIRQMIDGQFSRAAPARIGATHSSNGCAR